jgi:hypothetical protein
MKRLAAVIFSVVLCIPCCLAQSFPGIARAYGNSGLSMRLGSEPSKPAVQAEDIILPVGTHILMKLQSPLHTTSATRGSGVYLETSMPVVQDGRVVIPEHTRVLGEVSNSRRPGRVKGRARLQIRFTSLIVPGDRVLSITGALQSLPGSTRNRIVDAEGTLEPVDQIDKDVRTVARGVGPGAILGVLGVGGMLPLRLGLLGGGYSLGKVLFTRGDPISLPAGATVEMVLQHPLTVQTN